MLQVAIDAGPLHGHRTGVGHAVAGVLTALSAREDVQLDPYLLSTRAALEPGERRLPLPATLAHRLWSATAWPPMDRWLGHPALVHGTNYVVPPTRCPRVVSVYDCWFLAHPEQASTTVRRAGAVLRRNVDTGAHVVTSSRATEAQVRELLGTDRVTTVHLGPPPAPAADPSGAAEGPLALADGGPFVLALGTLERRKNVSTLVAAFDLLATDLPDVRLVLAGADGDDAVSVRTAIDRLRPDHRRRVHMLGPVSEEDKGRLLRRATVLAYPSLDEGFGFPILEAQLVGTPVVGSTAGSIPEVGGDAILTTPALDADALAGDLRRAITDGAERARLVAGGKSNVGRFTWEATAEALVDLYTELTDGH